MASGGRAGVASAPDPWPPHARPAFATVRDHARVARESFYFVSSRVGASLVIWLLIGIALALPGGLYLIERNLTEAMDRWEGRVGFSVYFEPASGAAGAEALAARLDALRETERVWVVTPEEALEEFRGHAEVSDALDLLEDNPLPASVRVSLADGVSSATIARLAAEAGADPSVEEVVIETTWLERLAAIAAAVERLGWMLAGLFGLGAALVTLSSVRLAIESRLEELRVQKLVGGTDAFVRRPFLYLGIIYGMGGGVLAAVLNAAALLALEAPLRALFEGYGQDLELTGLDHIFAGVLLGIGASLGVCGAMVASRQRLRGLEPV